MGILDNPTASTTAVADPAAAHRLPPQQRQRLALDALTGHPIAALARHHGVSRRFVYRQRRRASLALDHAFAPPPQGALRQRLGEGYAELNQLVEQLRAGVVRASSVVENVNSRLRGYFFLRREVGGGYLELLRFFLNHRRFLRSEHAERVGKSPAALLNGQGHAHGLELLGYQRFRRTG